MSCNLTFYPQSVQDTGEKLMAESNLMTGDIQQKLQQLARNWDDLKKMAGTRGKKLEESLAYQQFAASIEEEEAWINEKQHLLSGDDYGDSLAAVQGLLKKHNAFETDFKVHEDRCIEITKEGDRLIADGNHNSDNIKQRCQTLKAKLNSLQSAADDRKTSLVDNFAFLQFIWKTDVVESWIGQYSCCFQFHYLNILHLIYQVFQLTT